MNWFIKLLKNDQKRGKAVVVVSGLPRSGTSMMMAMLEAGGIQIVSDFIRNPDQDNPKGYYEYEPVKKLNGGDTSWIKGSRGKAVKVISALLSSLPNDEFYLVIFMKREMSEILASQKKMLINRGENPDEISEDEMAQYFENHLSKVNVWLENQKNVGVLYVDYNDLLKNPAPGVTQVNAFLGDILDEEKMIDIIDPSLYRQRKS
jgi:hypothetical protein